MTLLSFRRRFPHLNGMASSARGRWFTGFFFVLAALLPSILPDSAAWGQDASTAGKRPDEIYIPYKDLRETIEKQGRGVFLPYEEFQRLWEAAHRGELPAKTGAPVGAVIERVSYRGDAADETAAITAEVEFEVLTDDWTTLNLRLRDVAIREAKYVAAPNEDAAKAMPLLNVAADGHQLIVRGKGRYRLRLDFLKKLRLIPGRSVLEFEPISAAVATLELTVPVQGAEIQIEPLLAATTQPMRSTATNPVKTGETAIPPERTLVKAFVAPVDKLSVSWAAKSDLASGLAGLLESEQRHSVSIARSSVVDSVELLLTIRHAPRDRFEVRLPAGWRVLGLDAAQVQSWTVKDEKEGPTLSVKLYEAQKDRYAMRLELERAVQRDAYVLQMPIVRVVGAAREQGVLAVRQPDELRVQVTRREGMVQVDPSELPEPMRAGALVAMRFATADTRLSVSVARIEPKLSVRSRQLVSLDDQMMHLSGEFAFTAEEAGVFEVKLLQPAGWQVLDVGPRELVEDYTPAEIAEGTAWTVRLKRKIQGAFRITLQAQAPRSKEAEKETLRLFDVPRGMIGGTYDGEVVVAAKDHLELKLGEHSGMKPMPLSELARRYGLRWEGSPGYPMVLGLEFRDRQHAGPRSATGENAALAAELDVTRKKTRITAAASTLVDLTDAQTRFDTMLTYDVRYSDVEELRFRTPDWLGEDRLTVTGDAIREKRIVNEAAASASSSRPVEKGWNHWRVALTRPMQGIIRIHLRWDQPRAASQPSEMRLDVAPIYPEGALDHVDGQIAVRKTENFQVEARRVDGLRAIDVSEIKLAEHRGGASIALAFDRPDYALTLVATRQEFAEVAGLVVDRVLIEQVASRDGDLSTRMVFAVQSRSDGNAKLTLPAGAKLVSSAWVDGRAVTPQTKGGQAQVVLIPLPSGAEGTRRSIVEIAMSMSAPLGSFVAPKIESDAPVQETRWLVWVPPNLEAIAYDGAFLPADDGGDGPRTSSAMAAAQGGWASGGAGLHATLATEGVPLLFRRLGAAEHLNVSLWSRNAWRGLVNGLWLLLMLVGLRLSWARRAAAALVIVIVGALLAATQPLLVNQIWVHGWWGMVVLVLAWGGQWMFFRLPKWWEMHGGGWMKVAPTPAPAAGAPSSDAAKTPDAKGGASHA